MTPLACRRLRDLRERFVWSIEGHVNYNSRGQFPNTVYITYMVVRHRNITIPLKVNLGATSHQQRLRFLGGPGFPPDALKY